MQAASIHIQHFQQLGEQDIHPIFAYRENYILYGITYGKHLVYHYSLESENTGIVYVSSIDCKRLFFKIRFIDGVITEVTKSPKELMIVDLSPSGDRWEGIVHESKPYGWGCLYDENDYLIYEGFVDGSSYIYGTGYKEGIVNIIYGTEYTNGVAVYKGGFCFGKKMGDGIAKNYLNQTVFNGLWIDNRPIELPIELKTHSMIGVHSHVGEILFTPSEDGYNSSADYQSIQLYHYYELTKLVIADQFLSLLDQSIDNSYHFSVSHCLALESITIGNNSLCCFTSCTISDLPYLSSLEFGGGTESVSTFCACSSLTIRSKWE